MKVSIVRPRRRSFRFTKAAAALWSSVPPLRAPDCVRALRETARAELGPLLVQEQQQLARGGAAEKAEFDPRSEEGVWETAEQLQQLVSSAGAEDPSEDIGGMGPDAGAKLDAGVGAGKMKIENSPPAFGFEFGGGTRSLSQEASHSVGPAEPLSVIPRHYTMRTEREHRHPTKGSTSASAYRGQHDEDILATGRRTSSFPPSLVPAVASLSLLDEISSSSFRASSPARLLKNEMLRLLEKMSEAGPKTSAQFFVPVAHFSSEVVSADRKPAIEVAKDWLEGPGGFIRDGSAQKTKTKRWKRKSRQKRYLAEAGGNGTTGAKGEEEPQSQLLTSADPTVFSRGVRISLYPEESRATSWGHGENASSGRGPSVKKLVYSCSTSKGREEGASGKVCLSVDISECDMDHTAEGGKWSCKSAEGRGAEGLVLKEIRCPRLPTKQADEITEKKAPVAGELTAACVTRAASEALVGLLLSRAPGTSSQPVADCVVKLHQIVALEDDDEDVDVDVGVGAIPHLRSFRFLLLMEKVLPLSGFMNWQKPAALERAQRFADIHRHAMTCWRQLAGFGLVHNDLKPENLGFERGDERGGPSGEESTYKSSVKWLDFGGAAIVDVLDVPVRGADGADGKERLGKKLSSIPFSVILTPMPHFRGPHFREFHNFVDTERIEVENDFVPRRGDAHGAEELQQPDDAEHAKRNPPGQRQQLLQRQLVLYGTIQSPAAVACAPLAKLADKELRAWYMSGGNSGGNTARLATMHGPKTDLYSLALSLGQFLLPGGGPRDAMMPARRLWEPLHREAIDSFQTKMDPASCGACPHPKWVITVETLKRNYFCAAASKFNRTAGLREEEEHGIYHGDAGAATRVRAGAIVSANATALQLMEPEPQPVPAHEFIRAAAAIEQHLLCAATPQLDTDDGLYERETLLTCQSLCSEETPTSEPGSCAAA